MPKGLVALDIYSLAGPLLLSQEHVSISQYLGLRYLSILVRIAITLGLVELALSSKFGPEFALQLSRLQSN